MSRLGLFLCAMALVAGCSLLSGENRELRMRREAKLAEPVFRLANWHVDFDKARSIARDEGKVLFAYFTRSYSRCGGCDEVESGMLSSPEFRRFAGQVVLLLHITSKVPVSDPLPDERYPGLVVEKGVTSFPTFLFMDPAGRVIGRPTHLPGACEEMLPVVSRLTYLRNQPIETSEYEKELYFLELQLGLVAPDQITARASAWSLTHDEAALVAAKGVDAEVLQAFSNYRLGTLKEGEMNALLYALACAGRLPSSTEADAFWIAVLQHASFVHDAVIAERAYDALRRRFEGMENSWLLWSRPQWRQQLEASRKSR